MLERPYVEIRDEYGRIKDDVVVAAMQQFTLDIDGHNLDMVYNNMDEMSNACVLSFSGVESTEKFTLNVGAISRGNCCLY